MTSKNGDNGSAARVIWAILAPVILALAVFSIIGILFIPALCIYLDARSRTYTAAASVLLGSVALSWLWWPSAAAVCAFIAITTAAAYVLARKKVPFPAGLLCAAGGGVLGMMALLGILGATLGTSLSQAAGGWLSNGISTLSAAGIPGFSELLNTFTWVVKDAGQQAFPGLSSIFGPVAFPAEILGLTTEQKIEVIRPFFEEASAIYIPALSLAGGMLTGGLAYYLPLLALDSRRRKTGQAVANAVEVPPFAAFKIPKYVIISLLLVQILSSFGSTDIGFVTVEMASTLLFNLLMIIQALALLSFLLNRKKVNGVLQLLILAAALFLFWWVLPWVGIIDAFFDLRVVMVKVEILKAKGKQVFTPEGLDELRKMDEANKDKKSGKDGEDDKQ